MKIIISGIGGHMGAEVLRLAQAGYMDCEAVAGVDALAAEELKKSGCLGGRIYSGFDEAYGSVGAGAAADCIVDFSHHSATAELTDYAVKTGTALVIATTGQTPEELDMIKKASESVPVFHAANFSLGVALLIDLARKTAAAMPDAEIEIIEKHHDRKLDAPSGTALAIAKGIQEVRPQAVLNLGRSGNGKRTREEIGIHAIRMGNIVGEHEVIIGTQNQTITIKHEAHSRALFAEGALSAAAFLAGKPAGLYTMKDMIQ